ncbi:type IV pilus modification PilV family protein [Bacillus tuaregi]|uniref:type IV pilus modification PilV family protein n=1 Tax=Bacillus tuaregi TaxID=1816695 RepID=UPI0008F8206C|nr:prepilin-type N-terminal cleavage/methylation domain-containing protein [Bacillus tuaregi]
MNFFNQKGTTLIEVLLSIVILTIVLTSIMNFFPQMGHLNNKNLAHTNAVGIAKEELLFWQNEKAVLSALAKNQMHTLENYKGEAAGYYIFERQLNNYKREVKIQKEDEKKVNPSGIEDEAKYKAHYIHITIQNNQDELISETYGYIIYDTGVI